MKVLLVKHPTTHFEKTAPPVSGLPLGLLSIASCLKAAGHDVIIFDAIVGADEHRWDSERVGTSYQMGATWEEIRRVVADADPDLVGISNQFTSQVENALMTARAVKEVNRDITVVVGGPHASVMPSTFFESPGIVDFVVMGEGEETMVDLLDTLQNKRDVRAVKGISFMDGISLVIQEPRMFISDLDSIPFPAYDLIDLPRYFYFNKKGKDGREAYRYPGSERSVSMITSRGCPYSCIFCSIHLSMGNAFRSHSVSYVLEHIRLLKEKYGIRHIHFEDDNFSFDMTRFSGILDGMITNRFDITWDTPNGIRADYLNETILRKCRESGCTYIRIGVESANEYVSKRIVRKHLDLNTVVNVSKLCRKIGIDLEAFYLIGLPGETVPQMKETIDFAIRQERNLGLAPYDLFTATPLIGTEMYKICVERGYICSELTAANIATATQGEGIISTESFSPEILRTLLHDFRRRHLIAKILYSLRFMLRHPFYLVNRLSSSFYLSQLLLLVKQGKFGALLSDLFLYRYRNCVVRKIGIS
jgi:radical SAM superfamily enzyme YgiQ (UPF0313 family)